MCHECSYGLKLVSKRQEFEHLHFLFEDAFDRVPVEVQVERRAVLLVIPHDFPVTGTDPPDFNEGRSGSYPGERRHARIRIVAGIIDVVGVDKFPRQIRDEAAGLRFPQYPAGQENGRRHYTRCAPCSCHTTS